MSFYGNKVKEALTKIILDSFTAIPYELDNIGVEDVGVHQVGKGLIHLHIKHHPHHVGGPVDITIKISENL